MAAQARHLESWVQDHANHKSSSPPVWLGVLGFTVGLGLGLGSVAGVFLLMIVISSL
jgi:hypothetical protein